MLKLKLLSATTLLGLSLLFTACNSTEHLQSETPTNVTAEITKTQPQIEYNKITPHEAEKMIADSDVIILDVRMQKKYDNGHIPNAISLPNIDKAETVVSNKDQTVLIYCETEIESENAAKTLVQMGYTNVYIFGGIEDWTGKIIWNATNTLFYNYFGGELPADIVTPIDYSVNKIVNNEIGELEFKITGLNTQEYGLNSDKDKYYIQKVETNISTLTILDKDGHVMQEFKELNTITPASEDSMYGLSFDDYNFDGNLDICLWQLQGGSLLNAPSYYWLWDNSTNEYVENEELESISQETWIEADSDAKQVTASARYGTYGSGRDYYEYRDSSFLLVKSEERLAEPSESDENKYVFHVIVRELVEGEMIITDEYYEDIE